MIKYHKMESNFLQEQMVIRANGLKLKEGRFGLDIGEKLFTVRVVGHMNRLQREAVDAPSLEAFKANHNYMDFLTKL